MTDLRAGGPVLGGVSALPGTTAAAMVWRARGQLEITVIAKATFAFVPDGPMVRVEPERIVSADVHHQDNPSRSIRLGSDLVPALARAEVLFTGSAYAPKEGPRSAVPVRIGVFDGQRPLLDKRLLCRDKAAFERMSIVYERAVGGIGVLENPVGVGRDEATVVDPSQPDRPAGLGPIARAWPSRRRLLGTTQRKIFERPVVELPEGFEWSYFQAAPADQQIEALRGDEWIVLEGLHPTVPLLRTRLPGLRGHAWVHGVEGGSAGQRSEMRADTLRIDGDAQRCTVVFRLRVPVADEAALPAVRLVVTTTIAGEDPGDGRLPIASSSDETARGEQPADSPSGTLALPSSASPSATLAMTPGGGAAKPALPFSDPALAPVAGSPAPPASHRSETAPRSAEPARGSTLWLGGGAPAASPALPFPSPASARPTPTTVLNPFPEIEEEERPPPAGRMPGLPAPPPMLGPLVGAGLAPEAAAAPPPMLGPLAGIGPAFSPAPTPTTTPAAAPIPTAAAAPAAAPVIPAPEPLVDLSIEQLAKVAAELAERRAPRAQVLEQHGLREADFAAADERWTSLLEREASRGQRKLRSAHDAAYLAAVEGFRGPITVDDYARILVGVERGAAGDALDELSIQRPALMPLVRVWTRKVAADPRLAEKAKVLLASLRAATDGDG